MDNFNIYKRWGLPKKDLTNYPIAKDGYKCPNCGSDCEGDEDKDDQSYTINGESYPKMYNEVLYGDCDGTIHDWDELHKCSKCGTEFVIHNGCF